MIRCNNCGKIFMNEEDIPILIEWETGKQKYWRLENLQSPEVRHLEAVRIV